MIPMIKWVFRFSLRHIHLTDGDLLILIMDHGVDLNIKAVLRVVLIIVVVCNLD